MSAFAAQTTGPQDVLRQRVDEFVGLFFYGTMLKGMREHKLTKAKLGFGGRGEEAFASQLDQELAQRAGQATHNSIGDAIYRELRGLKATHGNEPLRA